MPTESFHSPLYAYRFPSLSYATCSVDPATCPDRRCDMLEQMSGNCPQDCVPKSE